jgi:hypothetical protein
MSEMFQVAIDAADPDSQTKFWAEALGYVVPPTPDGFETWDSYYASIGVPDDELGMGNDRLVDPDGVRPPIWFQCVPEAKTVKNRLHIDITASGGHRVPLEERRTRVDAKVRRLQEIGATIFRHHDGEVHGHYAVTMLDPEGNEFCVN